MRLREDLFVFAKIAASRICDAIQQPLRVRYLQGLQRFKASGQMRRERVLGTQKLLEEEFNAAQIHLRAAVSIRQSDA